MRVNECLKKCFKLAQLETNKSLSNISLYITIMLEIINLETKQFNVKKDYVQDVVNVFNKNLEKITD